MKVRSLFFHIRPGVVSLAVATFLLLGVGTLSLHAGQKPRHTGIRLEGFATTVEPGSITVFDKKGQEIHVRTDQDYTSLVGIAAPVTVWYTTEGGVNHLEDIVYPAKEGTFLPSELIRKNIKRIIILPHAEDVENSQGLISAISEYLANNTGWFVAPPELAQEIASRNEAFNSSEDAIDPSTDEVDMQRYLQAQGALMTVIAKRTHSDAVLQIKIIKVKANVHGAVASWDGMTEPVASRRSRAFIPWQGVASTGWVYAASADMSLWSQTGKLLWKNRRGFAVLAVQSGFGGKYHERPLTEVYKDNEVMQNWLVGTLFQLAPPVQGTSVESPEVSPEVKKQLDKAKQAGEEPK